jgi:putative hemolysin
MASGVFRDTSLSHTRHPREMLFWSSVAMTDAIQSFDSVRQAARAFEFTYAQPEFPTIRKKLIGAIESLGGRPVLERMYRDWSATPHPDETIFAAAIRLMGIDVCTNYGAWREIPPTGPVLIVANHPFGVIDGLTLGHLATLVRRDVKIMAHSLLCQPPEVRRYILPVDFAGTASARRTSARTRKDAVEWLNEGHVLVVFPAGGVATAASPFSRQILEAAWHPFVARLLDVPGLTVLPAFFAGQNSRLFHLASHVSYTLRLALLIFESMRHYKGTIHVTLGNALNATDFANAADKLDKVRKLRQLTYRLAGANGPDWREEFVWPRHISFT